jgi:hypothetical protein
MDEHKATRAAARPKGATPDEAATQAVFESVKQWLAQLEDEVVRIRTIVEGTPVSEAGVNARISRDAGLDRLGGVEERQARIDALLDEVLSRLPTLSSVPRNRTQGDNPDRSVAEGAEPERWPDQLVGVDLTDLDAVAFHVLCRGSDIIDEIGGWLREVEALEQVAEIFIHHHSIVQHHTDAIFVRTGSSAARMLAMRAQTVLQGYTESDPAEEHEADQYRALVRRELQQWAELSGRDVAGLV